MLCCSVILVILASLRKGLIGKMLQDEHGKDNDITLRIQLFMSNV
jgi:hypothetical protein